MVEAKVNDYYARNKGVDPPDAYLLSYYLRQGEQQQTNWYGFGGEGRNSAGGNVIPTPRGRAYGRPFEHVPRFHPSGGRE